MISHSQKLMTTEEVAAFLRLEPSTFLRKRGQLERETAFPPPVRGTKPFLWSPWGIAAWELRNLPKELRDLLTDDQRETGGNDTNTQTLSARLHQMTGQND